MRYELIYQCVCDCGNVNITYGITDEDLDVYKNKNILGVCDICGGDLKKKKLIKRKIDSNTKKIIPTDEEFNY